MSEANMQNALETLQSRMGQTTPSTDWFEMTQEKINAFADVTHDYQWIHVDVERAKDGPFGAPIAHGHLTLSIMGHLPGIEKTRGPALDGQKLAINYGFDRVRFPAPVPVGARIRASSTLKRAEIKGGMIEVMNEITVEIEGQDKPAVVAESLGRFVF
jgi:acyl dehydratase